MIERLESRIAPASLTMGGKLLTYTDIDGDLVKVTFTKAVMAPSDFFFSSVGGFLFGDTTTPQTLDRITLSGKTGAGFTLSAKPQKSGGHLLGDSHANLNLIQGLNTDLGTIRVDGNLVQIFAGDADFANGPGIKNLTVLSMGNIIGTLPSEIKGLGSLTVKTDLDASAQLLIDGGAGRITIGGSIIGSGGGGLGAIVVQSGGIGTLKVGGSLFGGSIYVGAGGVGTVGIRGSVVGGDNVTNIVPQVQIIGAVKSLSIGGDVVGRNGTNGGNILIFGSAGAIKIGGSLIGSDASATGALSVLGNVRSITIGHDLRGGDANGGTTVSGNGNVVVDGSLGTLKIGGDFIAGRVLGPGGSFVGSGIIGVNGTIGTVAIGGSVIGDPRHLAYITAGGLGAADGALAIKALTVKGSIRSASILAGYDPAFTTLNLLAGLGRIRIGGDLAGSFIIAGSNKGADNIPGNADDISVNSTTAIHSVQIGGAFLGRAGDPTNYYVYAPHILSFRVADVTYTDLQLREGPVFSSLGNAFAFSDPR